MNHYEQKKAARVDRLRARAQKQREFAAQNDLSLYGEEKSGIPLGQPILVGHHSERRHRRHLERIENRVRKGYEAARYADKLEERANAAESRTAIDSDDPEALNKLGSKVEDLEKLSSEMKRINAEFRRNGGKLSEIEMSESLRRSAQSALIHQAYYNAPFPPYALSNLRQRIAATKKRTEALVKANDFEPFEVNGIGVALVDGQIQVNFGYKPNEATRSKLKCAPLSLKWSRWSEAWVRKFTGQGEYFTQELRKVLEVAAP